MAIIKPNVGDIVQANALSECYTITNCEKHFIGEIIKVHDDLIDVKTVHCDDYTYINKIFCNLVPSCFDLVELQVPIAYIHTIEVCLLAIKKQKLYNLITAYDNDEALTEDIDYVLSNVIDPLNLIDKDIKIELK